VWVTEAEDASYRHCVIIASQLTWYSATAGSVNYYVKSYHRVILLILMAMFRCCYYDKVVIRVHLVHLMNVDSKAWLQQLTVMCDVVLRDTLLMAVGLLCFGTARSDQGIVKQ